MRQWAPKIALAGVSLLLVAGGLELSLRLLPKPSTPPTNYHGQRGYMRDDYALRWVPQENTRQERVDPYDRTFVLRINNSGQRGAELGPPTPQQRRVLFLGDSFTIASGLPEEDTFVAQTAQRL